MEAGLCPADRLALADNSSMETLRSRLEQNVGRIVLALLLLGCLFVLRNREPGLFEKYRTPIYYMLPITVVVLSIFAALMYSIINVKVIPLTAIL